MLIPPDGMVLSGTIYMYIIWVVLDPRHIYIYIISGPWYLKVGIYIISYLWWFKVGIFFALSSARLAQRRASPGHDLKLSCPRQNDVLGGPEICQFWRKKEGQWIYIYIYIYRENDYIIIYIYMYIYIYIMIIMIYHDTAFEWFWATSSYTFSKF